MPWLPPVSRPLPDPDRKKRRTTAQRGYGTEHRKLRATVMQEEPICTRCGANWSQILHHLDHDTGNTARSNLAAWCVPCHVAYHKECKQRTT